MSTSVSTEWLTMNRFVPLAPAEVRVWQVDTAARGLDHDACEALLSCAELERLRRMRPGVARNEFRVGRACLRTLLGAELKRDARQIAFTTGSHGKLGVAGVEFNVAHSRGRLLIALCRDTAVGVDLEWIDENIEGLDIAQGGFAPEEIAAIAAAPPGPEQTLAFYRCWTRKEAVVKAHGNGLVLPLADFAVSVDGCAESEVIVDRDGTGMGHTFHVRELGVGGGFVGAIASGRRGLTVRQYCLDALPDVGRLQSGTADVEQNERDVRVTSSEVTLPPYVPDSSAMGNADVGF